MAAIAVWTKIEEQGAVELLQEATRKLDAAKGDVTLDFSMVQELDAGTVGALVALATHAEDRGVKVILQGVNVDVYKVLKLVRLASRFVFV